MRPASAFFHFYVLAVMPKQKTDKKIKALEEAVAQADALAQQKSNFLATMSHEIRTPMQTIYGLLELISLKNEDGNIDSMVHTAQDAASALLEILDDVLDVAKMDADAMELDLFEVPVRLLVRGMLEGLTVKVRGAHVIACFNLLHKLIAQHHGNMAAQA